MRDRLALELTQVVWIMCTLEMKIVQGRMKNDSIENHCIIFRYTENYDSV